MLRDLKERVWQANADAPIVIAGERYTWISHAVKAAVTRQPTASARLTARTVMRINIFV